MLTNKPEISVVLLCYRSEEETWGFVEALKRSLEELNVSWELILVGNYIEGSLDQTPKIVKKIASQDPRIKAISNVKQGMMGWDMRHGLEAASGKTIAVLDGDGQIPLEDVARVYKKLKKDNMDMVMTYREKRCDGPYRRFISGVYNILFQILFPGLGCKDVNSKPKIFTEETYKKMELKSDDWFIDAEIMIQARRLDIDCAEIPAQFKKLSLRKSFIKPVTILEFISNLILFRLCEFRFWLKK